MSFKDVIEMYLTNLSAYPTVVSVVDNTTGRSNIVPVKRTADTVFMVNIEELQRSSIFTEYMERVNIDLTEQDKKIQEYVTNKDC